MLFQINLNTPSTMSETFVKRDFICKHVINNEKNLLFLFFYSTPEFVKERRNTMLPPAIEDTRSRAKDQPDYPFSSAK